MNIQVVVAATSKYQYAMFSQGKRIAAAFRHAKLPLPQAVVCGDASVSRVVDAWRAIGLDARPLVLPNLEEIGENYKEQAQLRIAAMRQAMHENALNAGADYVWSLDSDVLPPVNALTTMLPTLQFDSGYYEVAFLPYPNDLYLGGFGTPHAPILPNVFPDEREIPAELKVEGDKIEEEFKSGVVTPDLQERMEKVRKAIEECPSKGNVFALNAIQYRRRGWLEFAYPGIGKGAVVPVDWCGFGCNLMTRRATELARFEGYDGKGTEDLYINWHRWHPAGIRIACITHAPADHVIWSKKKKDERAAEYEHLVAFHEPVGECAGHLRVMRRPWKPEFLPLTS
jgi:hypothetical protein